MVQKCREANSIDGQVEVLKILNMMLPLSRRVKLQSMFTDDYVEKVLSLIEGSDDEIHEAEIIPPSLAPRS